MKKAKGITNAQSPPISFAEVQKPPTEGIALDSPPTPTQVPVDTIEKTGQSQPAVQPAENSGQAVDEKASAPVEHTTDSQHVAERDDQQQQSPRSLLNRERLTFAPSSRGIKK